MTKLTGDNFIASVWAQTVRNRAKMGVPLAERVPANIPDDDLSDLRGNTSTREEFVYAMARKLDHYESEAAKWACKL